MILNRHTALYCRLSKDDANYGESTSIKTQNLILEQYALDHKYYKYEFYVDDGYSGVNFERPEFERMIQDVKNGLVERVIVKDLSRFGRNYILVGEYVELLFPKYDVQFVSVSENMDSEQGNLDMMPINNLVNEWYARDISKKQKASVKARGNNGKRLTTKPIFGYAFDPADHSAWIIDETAAAVIRMIFDMYVSGKGLSMIAKYLKEHEVPTPKVYANENAESDEPYNWSHSTLKSLLSKQEYCGDTVNFRTERISYKCKKIRSNPPEKWVIFKDTHPAIISRETYDKAQEIIGQKRKVFEERPKLSVPMFHDVLYCADCGKKLYIMRKNGKHINSDSYVCSTSRKNKALCTTHYIKEDELVKLLTADIHYYENYLIMDETALKNNIIRYIRIRQNENTAQYSERVKQIDVRLNEIPEVRKRLFEEKLNGAVSAEVFADIMTSLDDETEKLKAERSDCLLHIHSVCDDASGVEVFLARLKKYLHFDKLTAEMIEDLVERIDVFEPEYPNPYTKVPRIRICYIGVGDIWGMRE